MYTDTKLQLEDGTTMTAFSADALSTSWLDFGSVVEDMGQGKQLYLNITVTTAAGGVGTVEFQAVAQPFTTIAALTTTTATFYDGSANIVTLAAHGLSAGTPIILSATGGAPTGVTLGKTYYVTAPTTNTFSLSTTLATALSGTPDATIAGAGTPGHTLVVPPLVLGSSGKINVGDLQVGTVIRVALNPLIARVGNCALNGYRYFFAKYIEGTNSAVAAAVTSAKWIVDLTESVSGPKYYPVGSSVS